MNCPSPSKLVCPIAAKEHIGEKFRKLLSTQPKDLASLYLQRCPHIDGTKLISLLQRKTTRFRLAGADFLRVNANPGFMLLEINSAPGFAYCTPGEDAWEWAYLRTAKWTLDTISPDYRDSFAILSESKIPCETTGFMSAFSSVSGKAVTLINDVELRSHGRVEGGYLKVAGRRITSGLRYLHTAPWTLLPPFTEGDFINPTDVDLAGARDKVEAYKAYATFNQTAAHGAPTILIPKSWEISSVAQLKECASEVVVKHPSLNSGNGVHFTPPLDIPIEARSLLAQEMIRPEGSSLGGDVRQILINETVHDLRMVVGNGTQGFFPLMFYARAARRRYNDSLKGSDLRAAMLTNISVGNSSDGHALLDCDRLVLPTDQGWEHLALSEVDFAVLFVQTALAAIAVEEHCLQMAAQLGK